MKCNTSDQMRVTGMTPISAETVVIAADGASWRAAPATPAIGTCLVRPRAGATAGGCPLLDYEFRCFGTEPEQGTFAGQ